MIKNDDVSFTSSALKIAPFLHHQTKPSLPFFSQLVQTKLTFLDSLLTRTRFPNSPLLCSASLSLTRPSSPGPDPKSLPILCSASLSLSQSQLRDSTQSDSVVAQQKSGGASGVHGPSRYDEERVLISEVLVRNKDGEELERKDLEAEALAALKACRANSALTVREVQEDVHRVISSGYFCSCMPVAVDTRDGIRLVFQVGGTHQITDFQSQL